MGSQKALWGTFSVADHLRERPFVADVLLYDLLVIPVPQGPEETAHWERQRRKPAVQRALLDALGKRALQLPWNAQRRAAWATTYAERLPAAAAEVAPAVRAAVAGAVADDARVIARERARQAAVARADPDPDDPAQLITRIVLQDELSARADKLLLRQVPTVEDVTTVVAYGPYEEFAADRGEIEVDGDAARPRTEHAMPVFLFQWPFLAPTNPDRSDVDLLKEAVELAHEDDIAAWREALRRWHAQSLLKGESEAEAARDMEERLAAYAAAARKRKIGVARRWACMTAAAAAGVAAVPFPPAGAAGALFGLAAAKSPHEIPAHLDVAALFYEARRRFG